VFRLQVFHPAGFRAPGASQVSAAAQVSNESTRDQVTGRYARAVSKRKEKKSPRRHSRPKELPSETAQPNVVVSLAEKRCLKLANSRIPAGTGPGIEIRARRHRFILRTIASGLLGLRNTATIALTCNVLKTYPGLKLDAKPVQVDRQARVFVPDRFPSIETGPSAWSREDTSRRTQGAEGTAMILDVLNHSAWKFERPASLGWAFCGLRKTIGSGIK